MKMKIRISGMEVGYEEIDVPESGYDRELRKKEGKRNPRKIVGMVEKREKKGEVKKRAKDAETNKEKEER